MSLIVDLVVLSRDTSDLPARVRAGIDSQADGHSLTIREHRIIGEPRVGDPHRWATIARARNEALEFLAQQGTSGGPFVMFLDDDVVLEPGCLASLVAGLRQRTGHAALAADYLGESAIASASQGANAGPWHNVDPHIAMGATLFRRSALRSIRFRGSPDRCECQNCCDDLRRMGLAIAYLPGARAHHEPIAKRSHDQTGPTDKPGPAMPAATRRGTAISAEPGRILTAFDRRHIDRFRRQFLASLRASGNNEIVTAIGYGLYDSERRRLAAMPGVELIARPAENARGERPPARRPADFAKVLAESGWPGETPVAYWDAGDVLFQHSLQPLWALVAEEPQAIRAVREPKGYPENPAIIGWTHTIRDPAARQRAFELLSTHPYLNSGFVAGTAHTLLAYFREADRLIHSSDLAGSTDWGDQTALNLFCHSNPARWREAPDSWNFCVHDRPRGSVRLSANGLVVAASGTPVHVVHGNALSLPQVVLSRRFA
jgi:hypothetical protein